MARWVWPTAAGVTTSLIGIVINLATEWKFNPWAWVCVAALTGLGGLIAMKVQATPPPPPQQPPAPLAPEPSPTTPARKTHNSFSAEGGVIGSVIQARSIGDTVNYYTVNQTAIARENSTIHQAGRDISPDDGEQKRKAFGKKPDPPQR